MYGHPIWQSIDKQGKFANPTRGQLNMENTFYSVPVPENLISRDWFGRPVLRQPGSFFIHRLILVLSHGIPPNFCGGVHLFII